MSSDQGRSQWGAGGRLPPGHQKSGRGEKNREGKKGKRKGKRGKERKEREEKGKEERKKKKKGKEKGRKREEGREREGKQKKKRKGRGINTVLIEIWRIIMTWILPRSIHQIARIQYKNSKIFQLLRGAHPPSDTPLCAQARTWRWRATGKLPQSCPPGQQGLATPLALIGFCNNHFEYYFVIL